MALIFGGAIHDAIEKFYLGDDPIKYFNDHFQNEGLSLTIAEEDAARKEGISQKEFLDRSFKEHKKEGKRLLQAFVEAQEMLTDTFGISPKGRSEHAFRVWYKNPLTSELLPVVVSGRFDRITDRDQILEFKTSSKPYTQEKADTMTQGYVYPQSFKSEFKKEIKEMFFIVLIKGRKNPIQVLKTSRTKEQQAQFFEQAKSILKNIAANQFETGTGFLHKYCDCQKYREALLIP